MPKVHNSNNLSKDDICKFYEFVCAYEKDYKYSFGNFNIDDPQVKKFCDDNDIALGKRPKKHINLFLRYISPKINEKMIKRITY